MVSLRMARNTKEATGQGKIRFQITLTKASNRALARLSRLDGRSKSNMLEALIRRESERAPQAEVAA